MTASANPKGFARGSVDCRLFQLSALLSPHLCSTRDSTAHSPLPTVHTPLPTSASCPGIVLDDAGSPFQLSQFQLYCNPRSARVVNMKDEMPLARRLGTTTHISPLRMKLERLSRRFPSAGAVCTEDWLVDVANDRGARIVFREDRPANTTSGTSESDLSTEELVVGICQLQCLDRPQMLRLAAQLISRDSLNLKRLCLIAERERAGIILAELARQALHVTPHHKAWRTIKDRFSSARPPRDSILHWTRLAEPVMKNGRCNAQSWSLVA